MIKLRNSALAVLLVFGLIMVFSGNVPTGWLTDGSDDRRYISLAVLADNDTLEIDVVVITSQRGRVLVHYNLETGDNSWSYELELRATEHVRVTLSGHIVSTEPYPQKVRCRIIDSGTKVRDHDKFTNPPRRRVAAVGCTYTS